MRWLWNVFAGWAEVCIRDPRPERMLNLCARRGAAVWGVERTDAETLRLCLRLRAWENIRETAKRMGLRTEVTAVHGFPVLRSRLEARPVLLFGLPVCLALLCAASLFVWDVRVETPGAADARLQSALREAGIHAGVYAKGIDAKEVQNELLLRLPEYKWIAVNIRGSRAVISLRAADPGPEYPAAESWDLVADRDGIITGFAVLSGTAAVKAGDTVHAGDVLVWGYETAADGARRPVRADAWCEGRSWGSLQAQVSLSVDEVTETETCKEFWAVFGKNAQKIWPWSRIWQGEYDTIIKREESSLTLAVMEETVLRRRTRRRDLSAAEAEAMLLAALRRRAAETCGEIRTERWQTETLAGAFRTEYTFEAEGPLGRPSEKIMLQETEKQIGTDHQR